MRIRGLRGVAAKSCFAVLAMSALLLNSSLFMASAPAEAARASYSLPAGGTLYPSGCHTYGYGPVGSDVFGHGNAPANWKPNCWLGESYINNAVYVAGIQVIDGDEGFNNGGRDGQFGPNTQTGVEEFQRAAEIGVDGIVGPQTWTTYGKALYWEYDGSNYWAYNVGTDIARFTKGAYTDGEGHYGPWGVHCGEVGFLFGDINYPNPKVPCV
jgi:Putative peptidoglycan binding domain